MMVIPETLYAHSFREHCGRHHLKSFNLTEQHGRHLI